MSETALAHVEAPEWRRKKTSWSSSPYSHARTEFRGVYRLPSGAYGSSIWDPPSRTRVWLGTFVSAEDAARTYAFAKAYGAAAAVKLPGAGKKRSRATLRGVQRRSSGRYGSSIWDPPSRTQVWLGTFVNAEDAARTYAFAKAYGAAAAVKLPGAGKKRSREALCGAQRRSNGRYGASVRERMGRALTSLGTFGTAEEVGRAYDAAAVELHGARAVTNSGPDSVVVVPGTQRHYISMAEWGRVEELLKDTGYSIDERDALIEAAAALHQIGQAGHGDGGRHRDRLR